MAEAPNYDVDLSTLSQREAEIEVGRRRVAQNAGTRVAAPVNPNPEPDPADTLQAIKNDTAVIEGKPAAVSPEAPVVAAEAVAAKRSRAKAVPGDAAPAADETDPLADLLG